MCRILFVRAGLRAEGLTLLAYYNPTHQQAPIMKPAAGIKGRRPKPRRVKGEALNKKKDQIIYRLLLY